MPETPASTLGTLRRTCDYPADRETVIDAVGDVLLRTPVGDAVSVETVLGRADVARYQSARACHETLMAHLDDRHIGRKEYDDRSPNPAHDSGLSL